jgi:hypothetical protein
MLPVFDLFDLMAVQDAEPFKAFEIFGNCVFISIPVFKLGGELGDRPRVVAGAEEVANGGELVFWLFGKGFDFGWGDRYFFTFTNTFDDGLGADFVGCLVFGTEPAYMSVTFFFGTLGVEGDEAIEDDFGETLTPSPSPRGRGERRCGLRLKTLTPSPSPRGRGERRCGLELVGESRTFYLSLVPLSLWERG